MPSTGGFGSGHSNCEKPEAVLACSIGSRSVGLLVPMTDSRQGRASLGVAQDLTGTMVGRFAVRARLGAGGMGEVYRADDTCLKRSVALKRIAPQLRTDDRYRRRFLKEAQRASQFTAPHIAGIYDVFEEKTDIFLVMEYVEGETLRKCLGEPLGLERFLDIAMQCAAAVGAAHEHGLVHHDIKPENIMLTPTDQVKILDFGVAREMLQASAGTKTATMTTDSGSLTGTLAYMAPEVLLGREGDGRADLFSLGVIFYEALTGQHPFLGATYIATSDRILYRTPAPITQLNAQVPFALERIVSKLLAKDPGARYLTASQLLVDLRGLERTTVVDSVSPVFSGRQARRTRWQRPILFTAVALALFAGLLTTITRWRQKFKESVKIEDAPREKNLAVLPFTVLDGDPGTIALGDGLTETVSAKLTQLGARHSLQVVPTGGVRTQGVNTADQARREFGVNLVLVGTLQRSGDMVRVTCTLVDVFVHRQLRAVIITAKASDLFAVEDQVMQETVEMLDLEVEPAERKALAAHGTQVADAYDLYLQGRGYLQNFDKPDNIGKAEDVFRRALEIDPNYALAYAGLGDVYWKKYQNSHESSWVESSGHACKHAEELDGKLPAARICLGTLENGTGQYEKAVKDFQQALEINPTSDDAYRGLASAYENLGRLSDAETTYLRAIKFRPNYWVGYRDIATFFYRHGRYAEAEKHLRAALQLTPDSPRAYTGLGGIYHLMGRDEEAIELLKKSLAISPSPEAYTNLGTIYYFQGRFRDAVSMMEKAVELPGANYLRWGNLGEAYYRTPEFKAKAPGAYEQAARLAEQQLTINPKDAEARAWLAIYFIKLGKKQMGLTEIEKARRLAPKNVNLLFRAAQAYELTGKRQQALRALQSAVKSGYSIDEIRRAGDLAELRQDPRYERLMAGRASQ